MLRYLFHSAVMFSLTILALSPHQGTWTLQGSSISCKIEPAPFPALQPSFTVIKAWPMMCHHTIPPAFIPSGGLFIASKSYKSPGESTALFTNQSPLLGTLHQNRKVSATRRLMYLWDDKSHLIFFHKTFNVFIISPIWVKQHFRLFTPLPQLSCINAA